jgi:signal transduction histidine kinase
MDASDVSAQPPRTPPSGAPRNDLAALLAPGVLTLDAGGAVRYADRRALELLGCADGFELERLWAEVKGRLEEAGLRWSGAGGGPEQRAELTLAVEGVEGMDAADAAREARRLQFDLRRDPEGGGVLLVAGLGALDGLAADLRLTSQIRSVAQIAPAVAHDLRAPINAMVFNIEILKEMLASGRATDPAAKDKLVRYTTVLKEELSRLHGGLETFLLYISPRGDREEVLDLRELAGELAALLVAPARKQQAQVRAELPEGRVPVAGNRYVLRQALLHLSLVALAGVPRQGVLHVRLEGAEGGRARLRLYGVAGAEPAAGLPAGPAAGPASPPPPAAPGFELSVSAAGSAAQLWVARGIVAALGGEARAAGAEGDAAGGAQAYEVELPISENPGNGNQGVS